MRFGNGAWLDKEGVKIFSPAQVYFSRIEENEITLCLPTSRVYNRGCTLGGVNLTMKISAPCPEVLRVQLWHYMGVQNHGPEFPLAQPQSGILKAEETEEKIIIRSGSVRMEICRDNGYFEFYRGEEKLTGSEYKDLAYVKTDWSGLAYDYGTENAYLRQRLSLGVGELVYGLGERFGAFVKNGQTVDVWNEDGGTSSDQAYKNVPFYLTNRGYGIFVNHPEKVSVEVASEDVKKVQFSVPGESLDYYVINGPTMKEVLIRYTDITGKPSLPAPWTFGLWLSTSFTTNYDEATVMSFVDGMLDRGIPMKVFHFDCFWMKEFSWCDFLWDSRVFPDPAGLIRRLKEKGLKICVWINPYVGQESAIFREGVEKGYFLKRPNGDVWQWDMWQPGLAIVDFTNPGAREWYVGKLNGLMDMGVDCFKTDFGERIPTDCVYFDGSDPRKMHNFYSYIYNQTVFDAIKARKGEGEAVVFARSATAGCQKFPVHWGGDCGSDYVSMAESLRGGLSFTSSGFGFWSHDISGFENTATPDVYKRWAAFGLLSTHSRLHGCDSYRVPWNFDEESVDVVRFFTRLKARLMPYLYAQAVKTSRTGVPMMRSMVMEFTEDRNCGHLATQYMLGDSLLVAPIFNDKSLAEFYLPEGIWTDLLTGERKEGGRWYKEPCGYLSIPLYIRENSIVALGASDEGPEYDYADGVRLELGYLRDGGAAETNVCDGKGKEVLYARAVRKGSLISVEVDAEKPCTFAITGEGTPISCSAPYTQEGDDVIVYLSTGASFDIQF